MNDDSVFHPPNPDRFSDDVIQSVVGRSTAVSDNGPNGVRLIHAHTPVRLAPVEAPQETSATTTDLPLTQAREKTRSRPLQSSEVEVVKLEFKRQRGRRHQEHYRARQRQGLEYLLHSIDCLRDEIQKLQLDKQIAWVYKSWNSTVWSVAVEYFRLFRFGMKEIETLNSHEAVGQIQRRFVGATMMPDVTDGIIRGIGPLLQSWQYMSRCYQDLDMRPLSMEHGPGGSIVAAVTCNFTITENTLRMAFPHLLECDGNGMVHPIATKLIGQRVTMTGSAHFTWDDKEARLTGIHLAPDLYTPLLHVLGSLEDVAYVFGRSALITPECKLIC